MWLSKLNEMSVGPLWILRDNASAAAEPFQSNCPVCGAAWLESSAQHTQVLIILADPIADPAQQTLLNNCVRAAGWTDVAGFLALHSSCSSGAGVTALERHLAQALVRRVMVFGERAAQSINPAFKRGALHQFGQTELVVTHHPAELLTTPALKAQTWSDLCLARFEE